MTTMVILDFLDRYKLDSHRINVNIPYCCITHNLGGTSADLLDNDTMSVYELLHGMMLPSGNDAAQALAIYFGHLEILIRTKKVNPKFVDANLLMEEYMNEESKEENRSSSDQDD
jgi:D-alanyl-D-alanine carboxypeptidase